VAKIRVWLKSPSDTLGDYGGAVDGGIVDGGHRLVGGVWFKRGRGISWPD
jgi:hypothetical protein